MKNVFEWKTMRWSKRKDDRIFSGRRLELDVELPAETLSQRQSPGSVQAAAERRVQDELHAAAVVKKSFEYEIVLRRHHAKHDLRASQILDDLLSRRLR